MSVVIETTLGDITVDLYINDRPRACLNFLKLCKIKYYNYNLFHTISRGFMAQTGDPTGTRTGGQSIYGVLDGPQKRFFEGENEPRIKHTKMGLISFVGNEDHMIGSQFFLTLGEDLTYLDERHCVFGEVVEGFDILEVINEVICDNDDRPYQDVRITHTVILEDPLPDPKRIVIPSRSPSPSAERLKGGRIAPDEEIDEFEGKSVQEVNEMQAEREAKARATILEMVGDLPDAEMAPPENVLFVCKLNPVTSDDDLEIIFSRFGKIKSCEVIRDKKTGDSLQYAFVEFEDKAACENAYFKMDNVLIDDRRIHVDFSQSVSKVKWRGKGRGVTYYNEEGKMSKNSDSDIGKGNYKLKRKDSSYKSNKDTSNKYREHSRSPVHNKRNENYSRHERERSRSYENDYRRKSNKRNERNDSVPLERKRQYTRSPISKKDKYISSHRGKSNTERKNNDSSFSRRERRNGDSYNSSSKNNKRSVSPRKGRDDSLGSKRSQWNEKNFRNRSVSPKRDNYKKDKQHISEKYKCSESSRKFSPDKTPHSSKRNISKREQSADSDSDFKTKSKKVDNRSLSESKKDSEKEKLKYTTKKRSPSRDKYSRKPNSDREEKRRRSKDGKKKSKRKRSTSGSSSDSAESSDEDLKSNSKKKKNKNHSSSESENERLMKKTKRKKKYDSSSD